MDYKKLHKDTIAKLQEMVNSGKITVEVARGICADFVPESEDERIRKELIDFLEYYRLNNVLDSKTIFLLTDSVAWLEKQGEKDKFIEKELECIKGYRENAIKRLEELEKQGEQGANGNEREIPNSSWSEYDSPYYDDICEILINILHSETADVNKDVVQKDLDWLKSLKDRVQPKVELTQLDKNILEAAIAFVEQNNHFNCWRGVDKHTVLSALHSLRPQSKWKPSDEQMDTLKQWLKDKRYDGDERYCFPIFDSLYQDLKKLKG